MCKENTLLVLFLEVWHDSCVMWYSVSVHHDFIISDILELGCVRARHLHGVAQGSAADAPIWGTATGLKTGAELLMQLICLLQMGISLQWQAEMLNVSSFKRRPKDIVGPAASRSETHGSAHGG
jgi:hypothetical protein